MSTHHGFWIAATDNRVFDGIVTRHLIGHGNIIAIHAYFKSDSYSFSDIVGRLKVLPPSPPVRVLFYTWAGRKPTGVDTIGSSRHWTRRSSKWTTRKRQRGLLSLMARSAWDEGTIRGGGSSEVCHCLGLSFPVSP